VALSKIPALTVSVAQHFDLFTHALSGITIIFIVGKEPNPGQSG